MEKIVILTEEVIDEIRRNQHLILKKLENPKNNENNNEQYISKQTASVMLDCDDQTIAKFENEGLIKRYGRGRFIRYSIDELKSAMGIKTA